MMKPSVADQPATKKAAAVKPPKPTNVILNDAQIASLKQRLKLSPSQESYWPELEAALRAVVKQIYEANREHIRDPALIYPGQIFGVPKVN